MSASILKNANLACVIPNEQQWHAHEMDRFDVAGSRHVGFKADTGPVRKQHTLFLVLMHRTVDVVRVRQRAGLVALKFTRLLAGGHCVASSDALNATLTLCNGRNQYLESQSVNR